MSNTEYIRIHGNEFRLNGQPIYFKGTNFQTPTFPWATFQVWDIPVIERCLDLARGLGCNVIRACLTPWEPVEADRFKQFIRMANARGMWIYVFFKWRSRYYRAGREKAAEDFVHAGNAARELSRWPGIMAYDVINEPDWVSHEAWQWAMAPEEALIRIQWLSEAIDVLHQNDPERPVSIGMTFNRSWWTPHEATQLLEAVDFVDFHYYRRTYPGVLLSDAIQQVRQHTNKPILVGEFGMSSDENYSTGGEPHHSETIQAETYREMIREIRSVENAGAIQWSLTAHNDKPRPEGENEYGIIRPDYTLKPAAVVFREKFEVRS